MENWTVECRPHLNIHVWLATIDLQKYEKVLSGFGGVEDLLDFTGKDFKRIGIKNEINRNRILTSLKTLKEKYKKTAENRRSENSNWVDDVGGVNVTTALIHSKPAISSDMKFGGSTQSLLSTMAPPSGSFKKLFITGSSNKINMFDYNLDENRNPVLQEAIELDATENDAHEQKINAMPTISTILTDQIWYHGKLDRKVAETLSRESGQFLVRDCLSKQGNYTLTCFWNNEPLHFMINRVEKRKEGKDDVTYETPTNTHTPMYQFEEEQFYSVADLVNFYVDHKKPVTQDSACIISNPINKALSTPSSRSPSLMDDDTIGSYVQYRRRPPSFQAPTLPSRGGIPNIPIPDLPSLPPRPLNGSVSASPYRRPFGQRVLLNQATKKIGQSQTTLIMATLPERSNSFTDELKTTMKHFGGSLPSLVNTKLTVAPPATPPPPKPTKAPSLGWITGPFKTTSGLGSSIDIGSIGNTAGEITEEHDYCDIDYDEMDLPDGNDYADVGVPVKVKNIPALVNPPPLPHRNKGMVIAPTERDSGCVMDFCIYDRPDPRALIVKGQPKFTPYCSLIDPEAHRHPCFLNTSKPLDDLIWSNTIIVPLLNCDPAVLAHCIFLEHCNLLELGTANSKSYGCGARKKTDLLLLPQGKLAREELLLRSETVTFFVRVTLLKCLSFDSRCTLLLLWVTVAQHLMQTHGDLFGFYMIMQGLENCWKLQPLQSCWDSLRRTNTKDLIYFDKVLRAKFRNLERGNLQVSPVASPICIPYLQPVITLVDRNNPNEMTLFDWEEFEPDVSIDAFWSWLSLSRDWYSTFKNFGISSNNDCLQNRSDVSDLFKTEFLLKFLYGTRGAVVSFAEKRQLSVKLEKVLQKLAHCMIETGL